MSATHKCPVDGCEARVAREHLLCRPHWFMVPLALRDGVWRAFRNWQGSQGDLAELGAAQDEAIAAANEAAKQESLL